MISPSVAKIMITDVDMDDKTPVQAPPIKKILKVPSTDRTLSPLKPNKHHEQDYVGKDTIDVINKQAAAIEEKKLAAGK